MSINYASNAPTLSHLPIPLARNQSNTHHVPNYLARYRVRPPSLSSSHPNQPLTSPALSANRGIGLELVKQLVAVPTNVVVAACRNPDKATALAELKSSAKGTLHLVQLDVSDFDNIRALPKQLEAILGSTGLDYLISNAGIVRSSPRTLHVLRLTARGAGDLRHRVHARPGGVAKRRSHERGWPRTALPGRPAVPREGADEEDPARLEHGRQHRERRAATAGVYVKRVVSDLQGRAEHARTSARLVDSGRGLTRSMRAGVQAEGRAAGPHCDYAMPGVGPDRCVLHARTVFIALLTHIADMGGADAALKPEESVAGIIKVITNATKADSGKYLRHTGEEIPW